ncbi:MAG: recombinase family protein [Chloroflexota bacterium]|nr:recombinase family protein [Chloroflexota bacterium]
MNAEQHSKISATHLLRRAYLYVRQSTLRQVLENTESTKRQYALRERAIALGWPSDRVVVIDSDLGRSGADRDREGFARLVAAVGLGEVGVVLGLEVSRLARSSTDWHRLLEICALTDTLICDEDGLYDPGHFNDRLLLGLKGTMSEAELHVLRARLLGGQRAKASRGELEMRMPVGLVTDPVGRVVLDPDAAVVAAVRTFFLTFQRTGSATATVRAFREQGLLFPRRLATGPHAGEVAWGPLLHHRALRLLKNPRYTGAFVYGRTRAKRTATGTASRIPLPREEWHTLLLDRSPAYISWDEYEANLRQLHENAQANGAERRAGPPREGPALLQGLVVCGRCGGRMTVRYAVVRRAPVPEYVCQREAIEHARPLCAVIGGAPIDRAIGDLLVETVSPLALEAALGIEAELAARAAEADGLRRAQVERARYEAELAQRRYLRVDPDNRLVADSLEADWNAKLRALVDAQEAYERVRESERGLVGPGERARILALATDFPRLWADPATPQRERKRMVRLLLDDVTLVRTEELVAHVRFRGGAVRTIRLPLPRSAADLRRTDPAVVAELDRLLDDHTDAQAAELLNARGVRPGVADRFTVGMIVHLRHKYGLTDRFTRLRARGLLTLPEISEVLAAHPSTVKVWARQGRIASVLARDNGERLFPRPAELQRPCGWCGGPIPARPALRGGKKWCRPGCCYAAYRSRKRAAAVDRQTGAGTAGHGSALDAAHEVQSVA